MLSFLKGSAEQVHDSDDPVAYELAGSSAVFQNGYKLRYNDKKFVAKTVDEAVSMIKSWMEESEKKAKSKDKADS